MFDWLSSYSDPYTSGQSAPMADYGTNSWDNLFGDGGMLNYEGGYGTEGYGVNTASQGPSPSMWSYEPSLAGGSMFGEESGGQLAGNAMERRPEYPRVPSAPSAGGGGGLSGRVMPLDLSGSVKYQADPMTAYLKLVQGI
jgi:hypothetical protein